MNREAKNATITLYNLRLKAEIYWQTSICQKLVDHYREDLPKQGTKGQPPWRGFTICCLPRLERR